jgi:hypothetical protein
MARTLQLARGAAGSVRRAWCERTDTHSNITYALASSHARLLGRPARRPPESRSGTGAKALLAQTGYHGRQRSHLDGTGPAAARSK